MQDRPDPADILDLTIKHLGAIEPGASAKFEMRLAQGALQLVQRALEREPKSDAAERQRLRALLGQDGDLDDLNRELCARIKTGALDLTAPSLAAHLWATTLEKLAIDQPSYEAYRRALEKAEG